MAGFSGATGVPKKYVDDAIAQSTAITYRGFVENGATFAHIDGAKEYIIIAQYGTSAGIQALSFTFDVPAELIKNNVFTLTDGYYLSSTTYGFVQVVTGPSGISLARFSVNGTEYASTSRLRIYTR